MPDPEPIQQLDPLPPMEAAPQVAQRQAAVQQQGAMAPSVRRPDMQIAPPPPAPVTAPVEQAPPPPQLVNNTDEEAAIVKRRKSKRKELQQASSGTDALRIPLAGSDKGRSIGAAKGGTGSTGLNIPK